MIYKYRYENQFQTKTKHHLLIFVTQQITGVILDHISKSNQ